MADLFTIQEFASRIKAKYPDYADIPDEELTRRIVTKYPDYKNQVALPSSGTTGSFEVPGILDRPAPYIPVVTELARFGKSAVDTATGMATSIAHSISAPPETPEEYAAYAAGQTSGFGQAALAIHRMAAGPQIEQGRQAMNPNLTATERFGHGLAAVVPFAGPMAADIGETLGTEGLPEAAGKAATYYLAPKAIEEAPGTALSAAGKLRERARSIAQTSLGAGEFKTTGKQVKSYLEKSEKAAAVQQTANKRIAELNAQNATKTTAKNVEREAAVIKKNQQAKSEFQQQASQTIAANRESALAGSRLETTERSVAEGSRVLGERVRDLDTKLRTEANEKYTAVTDAVKADPGEPVAPLADAVQHAETNILKGSPESIKQFRDIVTKGEASGEGAGIQYGGDVYPPGHPFYEALKSKGALKIEESSLPFDQLQGYSSELGQKLASGNLPGDVYQALKYVKQQIDAAKTRIADRNGAGALLRNADTFWNRYMDTFYDKDSAVAKVRESVGVLDPQYYAEPFTKGKAAEVGIGKLQSLPTRHAEDAAAVANLANQLRSAHTEVTTTNVPKAKPLPAYPTTEPVPKPLEAPVQRPVTVRQPAPPTAESILASKAEKVRTKAHEVMELRRFDAMVLAGSAIGVLVRHNVEGALLGGAGAFGFKKALGSFLDRPAVINWIAQPTEADLAAVSRLPEPVRADLGAKLRSIMDQERQAGRVIRPDPRVAGLITMGTANAASTANNPNRPVRTRQEALDLLNNLPRPAQ